LIYDVILGALLVPL